VTKVLVSITADPLSIGHLNLIDAAAQLGPVHVAVLSDQACQGNRQQPAQSLGQRVALVAALKPVHAVLTQQEWSYADTILREKPTHFVHSDNWNFHDGASIRQASLDALKSVGGQLVEVPYSQDAPWTPTQHPDGALPEARRRSLSNLLTFGRPLAFMEAHSPLSALILEKYRTVHGRKSDNAIAGFDGIWSSSLSDSTVRGVPDTEKLEFSQRMTNIQEIFQSSTLPLIYDADTGGQPEHLQQNIRQMESSGISACIIEDKTGLKRNSLFGNEVAQTQDSIEAFSEKITTAVRARDTTDFMVFARIESLILDKGLADARARASAYLEAGASGIMIHSRRREEDEIAEFSRQFKKDFPGTPLVLVPTSYNHLTLEQLGELGADVVIFANHMLRASHQGMERAALSVLKNGRTLELDGEITSVSETLSLIPETRGMGN